MDTGFQTSQYPDVTLKASVRQRVGRRQAWWAGGPAFNFQLFPAVGSWLGVI